MAARQVLPVTVEWGVYVAALVAAGGMLFLALAHDGREVERSRLARLVIWSAAGAAAATVVAVPLQAFRIVGASPDIALLDDVLGSGYGLSALVRLGGLLVVLLAVSRLSAGRAPMLVGGAGALVVAWSFVLVGHTVSGQPRAVVVTATAAHLTASALWFGGLVLLRRVLTLRAGSGSGDAAVVTRFSTLAGLAVAVLAGSGAALAWAHGRTLAELAAVGYGWALAVKVVVVAGVLLVGAHNRWRLVPAISRGEPGAWRGLQRTVGVEAWTVGIVVVGVTAVLVNLAPPAIHVGAGL